MATILQFKDQGNVAVTFESQGRKFSFIATYDGTDLCYKLTEQFGDREREIENTTVHHSGDIIAIEDFLRL